MKSRNKSLNILSLFMLVAVTLSACSPTVVTQIVTQPAQVQTQMVTSVVTQEVNNVVTATSEPTGPVTITFWQAYNTTTETPYIENTLIPAFEAANPNIKVQDVNIPYNDFHQKYITAIAGGTAPDVARLDIIWVPEFGEMGALAPMDQIMTDFSTYKDAVFSGPLSTTYVDGHYYALPLDTNTRVLFYNKDVFKKAGLDAAPKTWDEFETDCAKIKATSPDVTCYADGGTYAWAVDPFIWSFGGSMTSADYTKATGFLNDADTIAAYQFLRDGITKGYIGKTGILGGNVDTEGGLAKGQIAMILDGPWYPPTITSQYPNANIGTALVPAGKGGSISVVGGEDIAISQESQHKDAAMAFVRFMLSEDTQMKMGAIGQMPVLKSSTTADNLAKLPTYYPIFLQQLDTAQARTPVSNWTKMETILTDAGTAILNGSQTAKDALTAAAAQIDPLLPTLAPTSTPAS